MDINYLTGTWEGFYTYGPEYPVSYRGRKDAFTVRLTVDEGIIKGTSEDWITREQKHPATVEGMFIDGTLSFVLKYRYLYTVDEDGTSTTDWSKEGHEIHYVGKAKRKLFSRQYYFAGTWDISGSFLDESGEAFYYSDDGEWEMHLIH